MAKNRVFQEEVITVHPLMRARDNSFIAKPRAELRPCVVIQ